MTWVCETGELERTVLLWKKEYFEKRTLRENFEKFQKCKHHEN